MGVYLVSYPYTPYTPTSPPRPTGYRTPESLPVGGGIPWGVAPGVGEGKGGRRYTGDGVLR